MSDITVASAFGGRHAGLGASLFRAIARVFEKRAMKNAIRELNAMDDRQLDDIGLSRADADGNVHSQRHQQDRCANV